MADKGDEIIITSSEDRGWRRPRIKDSLPEAFASVKVPYGPHWWKRLLAFTGPGMMVAVGYMDPGNWATDIAGGARFGYAMLTVILASNIFAMVLQHLALKLGIVSGRDLAQACRDHYSRRVSFMLWVMCEIAIAACDLAEVIGSAIALNLLFGLPLTIGVVVTIFDVLIILFFQSKGYRFIEALVMTLIIIILSCFAYELVVSNPNMPEVLRGFLPTSKIVFNPGMLYVAIGILGATVMPHNLYLHSSIVQTRDYERNDTGKRMALKYSTIDSTIALFLALFINAAILILATAAFHFSGHQDVVDISDAQHLLTPVLGASLAGVVFAIALLASGQNSTLTGTLAGQIVMEGFLNLKMKPWLRRLVTRLIAVVPAFIVVLLFGERGIGKLLILSQVILSMQLGFAVVPLVIFTNDKAKMGTFANSLLMKITAWVITALIIGLNGWLLVNVL